MRPPCDAVSAAGIYCGRAEGHAGEHAYEPCARCSGVALPESDLCNWCVATWRGWATGAPAAYAVPLAAWENAL